MNSSSSKIISTIIGVVVIVLIVVGLVWLSNSQNTAGDGSRNSGQDLSPEEVSQILKELSKPPVGADGKPVPPPTAAETKAILEQLSQPSAQASGSASAKEPTPAEIEEMLKQLQTK